MREPTEKILKVTFHIGQQFGTAVKNTLSVSNGARFEWHYGGIKISYNNTTRICSLATVHGVDVEFEPDNNAKAPTTTELLRKGPGRPRVEGAIA